MSDGSGLERFSVVLSQWELDRIRRLGELFYSTNIVDMSKAERKEFEDLKAWAGRELYAWFKFWEKEKGEKSGE